MTLRSFKPNPKRQVILIGLALLGLGFGYGLGFVFKRPSIQPTKPQVAVAKPAALPVTAPERPLVPTKKHATPTPTPSPPLLPETHPEARDLRAYEEALPDNIVETIKSESPSTGNPIKPPPPEPPAQKTTTVEKPPEPQLATAPSETTIDDKTEVPTWRRNALSVAADGGPMIAVVFDDLGVDKSRTRRTIALHGPLTLSFLAYATNLKGLTELGRAAGHEIFLHVPMEPSSRDIDPGPNVLLTNQPRRELLTNFRWNLNQMDGYVGINNHMGSRFTENLEGMTVVMGELKKRGLAFLDSVTSSHSVGRRAATAVGVPFITRNIFIDHDEAPEKIQERLHEVERLAKRQGHAIAIGHPRETTLQAVEPWLAEVTKRGFQLVPASTLIRREEALLAKRVLLAPRDLLAPQAPGAR